MTASPGTCQPSRDYYDELARTYQDQDEFWQNPYDTEVWRLEHALLAPHLVEGAPLLDLGCGFYPHDEFPANIPIVAADLSYGSLSVATRFFPREKTLIRVQCDATLLPFRDRAIRQVIAGGELLNHLDYRTALREVHRVLVPGGIFLFEFGTKWCLDSLWALGDSVSGGHIGYGIEKAEAREFLRYGVDPWVTWDVTPTGGLRVQLIRARAMLSAVRASGFEMLRVTSTNALSGLVPLPVQQESSSSFVRAVTQALLTIDRTIGRLSPLNLFAGNVFVLCRRPR